MKKFFAMALATVAVCLASCGGKTAATADPDSLNVEETAVEAALPSEAANQIIHLLKDQMKKANVEQIKVIATSVAEKVAEFVAAGDQEAAQTYTAVINNFIAENATRLKEIGAATMVSEALASVSGLPTNIADAAAQAAEGVKTEALTAAIAAVASGDNVLDAVKSVAGNAVESVVGTATGVQDAAAKVGEVQEAAAAAKAAVEAAPEAAKQAAAAKAQEAADAAKQKAAEETNKAIDNAAAAAKKKLGL